MDKQKKANGNVLIAGNISASAGIELALCIGTAVGGAMFGDNLSFISDTTIAATKTGAVNGKRYIRNV